MLMAWGYVDEQRSHRIVKHLKGTTLEAGRVTPLQMNFLIDGLFTCGHAQYVLDVIRERDRGDVEPLRLAGMGKTRLANDGVQNRRVADWTGGWSTEIRPGGRQ